MRDKLEKIIKAYEELEKKLSALVQPLRRHIARGAQPRYRCNLRYRMADARD